MDFISRRKSTLVPARVRECSALGTEAFLAHLPVLVVVVIVPFPLARLRLPSSGFCFAFCLGAIEGAMLA
jgi:hypothetical protein